MTNSTRQVGEAVIVPAESLLRLRQDILGGVWRGCRPAFTRDGAVEGWPSFSMADLHEIAAAPASDLEQVIRERDEAVRHLQAMVHVCPKPGEVEAAVAFLASLSPSNGGVG